MLVKSPPIVSICVFCGSSYGKDEKWQIAARALGAGLAHAGITLVYGGSHSGLMGQIAEAALAEGGRVEGVIPRFFLPNEDPFDAVTELTVVEDMHTRKALMFNKADGFCILPGGLGTLDETFEILTWKQLGLHDKPILIINIDGYWTPFLSMIETIITNGFAQPTIRDLFHVVDTIEAALTAIAAMVPAEKADISHS